MHSTDAIAQNCEDIFVFERQHQLLDKQVAGVYAWRLVRKFVYLELSKQRGIYSEGHPNKIRRHGNRATYLAKLLWHSLRYNPYRFYGKRRFFVCPHNRVVNGVDIYSDDFTRQQSSKDVLLVTQGTDTPFSVQGSNMAYVVLLDILRKLLRLRASSHVQYTAEDEAWLDDIERRAQRHFGCAIPLKMQMKQQISQFHLYRGAYKKLLRHFAVEHVYIVVAYFRAALVDAAKALHIPVYDWQHGTMFQSHLGYYFPDLQPVPYSPDKVLCFGRFWCEVQPFSAGVKSVVVGSSHVEALKTMPNNKRDKQVLVTSQGTIGPALFGIVSEAAQHLPDYHFVYKPHPSEIREEYAARMKVERVPANFRLAEAHENTYALMAASTHLVGVYSTTIFEGMALGCRTVIVRFDGCSYLQPLVERGDAIMVGSAGELVTHIAAAPLCRDANYYYASPVVDIHAAATGQ